MDISSHYHRDLMNYLMSWSQNSTSVSPRAYSVRSQAIYYFAVFYVLQIEANNPTVTVFRVVRVLKVKSVHSDGGKKRNEQYYLYN